MIASTHRNTESDKLIYNRFVIHAIDGDSHGWMNILAKSMDSDPSDFLLMKTNNTS